MSANAEDKLEHQIWWADYTVEGTVTISNESGRITLDVRAAVDELHRVARAIEDAKTEHWLAS